MCFGDRMRWSQEHKKEKILETIMPHVNIATSATACLIAGIAATFVGSAYAESYPSKPVTLIVPFSAGGGADIIARTFAKELSSAFSQPVIV
jgi:tripartite-type tricarboxylate transporter receptor subunit TctC